MLNRIVRAGIVLLAGMMAAAAVIVLTTQSEIAIAAPPSQVETAQRRVITVTGTGRVTTQPDQATINIGAQITAPTLAEATKQASDIMTKVLDAIKKQGVDAKDIQTSSYNVNPITNYKEGQPPQITGYQVTNIVNVTVKDLTKLGAILDAGMTAGANYLGGITFSVADTKPQETAARTEAVKDATASAQTLAQAAGVKLGKVITITEGSSNVPPPIPYGRAMAADAAAPGPVETGSMEISVNVQMQFEIVD